jgi:kinesin family protein 18/19
MLLQAQYHVLPSYFFITFFFYIFDYYDNTILAQTGESRVIVNNMRQRIVENFQERMQLRRSLIELEDQNVQNSIEVSKRQLLVVQWIDHNKPPATPTTATATMDASLISSTTIPGGLNGDINSNNEFKSIDQNNLTTTEKLIASAPDTIRESWSEVEQLRTAMAKNNGIKKNIGKRLKHNEKEAEKVREELEQNITGEDRKELMELQYQVGR